MDGERVRDPKRVVAEGSELRFAEKSFVSRGGDKLEHALEVWKIDVKDRTVLDAGSSTGGFTDCLLRRGAAAVHAVDVGFNQMHPGLRADPRVLVRERTNIMSVDSLEPVPLLAVCDLSFRSLRGAARHILALTSSRRLVALVKPQFEWENPGKDFDGVVRAVGDLANILADLADALQNEGVFVADAAESPIRGRSGNREFFFDLRMEPMETPGAVRKRLRELAAVF